MEIQNFLNNKKYIGIIAAMTEEIESIKKLMKDISVKNIYELEFILGTIHSKNVVLVKCGVGKVNAARTTQILIDKFDIECIINAGSGCATGWSSGSVCVFCRGGCGVIGFAGSGTFGCSCCTSCTSSVGCGDGVVSMFCSCWFSSRLFMPCTVL